MIASQVYFIAVLSVLHVLIDGTCSVYVVMSSTVLCLTNNFDSAVWADESMIKLEND